MKNFNRFGIGMLLTLLLTFALAGSALAAVSPAQLSAAVNDTAKYVQTTVTKPEVGSIGGEWAVLGLARSGYNVPDKYYQDYYSGVEAYVKECKGVLHDKKYTEYSRVIVALAAIGKDARDVAGYDLTKPLGDYEKTIWQGLNGPIWALIALDSRDYPMPQNTEAKTQATRQMYVDRILACQLSDGGWSLFGGSASASAADSAADPDITGMALQALAKYQDQPKVAKAIEEALACMSKQQKANGGFSSWGTENSESCVQMIVALNELGISLDDERFVKGGNTLADALFGFYREGKGFLHTTAAGGDSQMATEQGFYGLVSMQRAQNKQNSLYRMVDAKAVLGSDPVIGGADGKTDIVISDKNADVKKPEVVQPGKTFPDIAAHANKQAIEALAGRAVIDGDGGNFLPDKGMTRAEFATIVVRALGLAPKANNAFTDIAADAWYAPFIGTASTYGIINGVGEGKFDPNGPITRQEAAVMVARAAGLCGIKTDMDAAAVRDELSQFTDYVKAEEWARQGLAVCYSNGILDDSAMQIQPTAAVKRCEIAQMLYNLLDKAGLL